MLLLSHNEYIKIHETLTNGLFIKAIECIEYIFIYTFYD